MSASTNVSKYAQVFLAIACRYWRSAGGSAARRFAIGRLSAKARNGAAAQSASRALAAGNAPGRTTTTSRSVASASRGLARIPERNADTVTGPPRAALAAVVSHSRRRRRVTPNRTSVMPIACVRSQASFAMKVSCRPARAASVRKSSILERRKLRHGCPRRGPLMTTCSRNISGRASAANAIRVQTTGRPGRSTQPARSSSSVAGGTTLRRRLSRIFQRAIIGSRLR